jgi:hypothetical protein
MNEMKIVVLQVIYNHDDIFYDENNDYFYDKERDYESNNCD